jgi:LAS superfamily LD-carboxypeptidase LdcB
MRLLGIVLVLLTTAAAADARTVTGYSHGEKTRIKLVEVSGVELEASTAKAFKVMARAARKAGIEIAIRSGFRSQEKQQKLYRDYQKGRGHLAARPGYSNHQSGHALDIYITDYRVYEWLKGHAAKYGFKRTVRSEAWHWEYVGGEQAQARSAPR